MRKILSVALAWSIMSFVTSCAVRPVPVIFDTDIGNDIDDVLALEMLLNYEQEGMIDLLGISICKSNVYSVEYTDAYCRMHGRGDIPIGFVYDGANPEDGSYTKQTLDTLINGRKILTSERSVNDGLPEGYKLIRKLLAEAADHSVVFIATGPETNLARLLDSEGDEYSPLSGKELIAQKVKLLSIMAGLYGNEFDFPEWNVLQDIESARKVFDEWPGDIVASGWELGYKLLFPHESILNDFKDADMNPLCVSYKLYGEMPYDRPSWDLTSVLYGVEPLADYFDLSETGTISIDKEGHSVFSKSAAGKHRYLVIPQDKAASTLDALVSRVTDRKN